MKNSLILFTTIQPNTGNAVFCSELYLQQCPTRYRLSLVPLLPGLALAVGRFTSGGGGRHASPAAPARDVVAAAAGGDRVAAGASQASVGTRAAPARVHRRPSRPPRGICRAAVDAPADRRRRRPAGALLDILTDKSDP